MTAIQNGATVADAARENGLGESTVNGWIRRGRDDSKSKYGKWTADIDAALRSRRMPAADDRPADRGELLMMASRAARAGNVQAMRLLAELLEPTDDQGDALSAFDGKT